MTEKEALHKAIRHYEGAVNSHNPMYGKCYAIPILEALKKLMARLKNLD